MVGAASDAKRRRWLDRMRDYGGRSVERRHIFSDVTGRPGPHCREDGSGDLKMAVSLEFGHFQRLGWK
jgi:hypothetical protein